MNYIIRDKQSREVLYIAHGDRPLHELTVTNIYPDFNPGTMEVGWTHWSILPEAFDIAEDGQLLRIPKEVSLNQAASSSKIIHPLSLKEQVAQGKISLRSPFEYLDGDNIAYRSLDEIVEHDAIQSREECEFCQEFIKQKIESEIESKYPIGKEMKLTKNYLAWLNEDKPKKDEREASYLNMQEDIDSIKQKYANSKDYVKQKMLTFPIPVPSDLPTMDRSKKEIQAYLAMKGIPFTAKETKQQLLDKLS